MNTTRYLSGSPASTDNSDDHELIVKGPRPCLTGQRNRRSYERQQMVARPLAPAAACKPDLALIDVRMPEMDGLATRCSIKQACLHQRDSHITAVYEKTEYLIEALSMQEPRLAPKHTQTEPADPSPCSAERIALG